MDPPVPAPDVRWRELTEAICTMGRELSVAGRLQRTVEAAGRTAHAQYAAMALQGHDGTIDRLVLSETDPDGVAVTTALLARHGVVLGAPVGSLREPTGELLGISISGDAGLYGHLYVLNPLDGGFSDEDRSLLASLAETTAVGVDCATNFEESQLQQLWLSASGAVSQQLLSSDEDERRAWQQIAESVLRLTRAETVTIVVPVSVAELQVSVAAGAGADRLPGRQQRAAGSLAGSAMAEGRGCLSDPTALLTVHPTDDDAPAGPAMALPLVGAHATRGAVVASRAPGAPPFLASDLGMGQDFARQAALALELAEARTAQRLVEVQDERDRIGQALQDQVIQRLFSIGLSLQSTSAAVSDPDGRGRLERAIEDIDETIRQVRAVLKPAAPA